MEVVKGVSQLARALVRPVVTIGNFDGVHLGHREIIRTALEQAKSKSGECVVYTFRPHPQMALRPERSLPLLTTYDEKIDLISKLGPDVLVEEPFGREFSTMSAETFFNDCLINRLNAETIVVGYDFAFGKSRDGHLDQLQALCTKAGIKLMTVSPVRVEGEVTSSSRIRQYITDGQVTDANRLLGYEFFYRGPVIRGDARGRTIGFPTANLRVEGKLTLPLGVYATQAVFRSKTYAAVTNVGVRPTFRKDDDEEPPVFVETHFIGEDVDLYGESIEVKFFSRLRGEIRFDGIESLKAQIVKDVAQARSILPG